MKKIDIQHDELEQWAQQKAAEQQMDLSSFVEALLKERMASRNQAPSGRSRVSRTARNR